MSTPLWKVERHNILAEENISRMNAQATWLQQHFGDQIDNLRWRVYGQQVLDMLHSVWRPTVLWILPRPDVKDYQQRYADKIAEYLSDRPNVYVSITQLAEGAVGCHRNVIYQHLNAILAANPRLEYKKRAGIRLCA